MSQGSSKGSKVRLQALPASPSIGQDASITADYLPKISEGGNEQNQLNKDEPSVAKEPVQNFDTIRDPHKSMLQVIDCMFDLLQAHVYEANKVNVDGKLQFHIQRPTLEKQINKSWLNTVQQLPAFTGKIYTYDWSLIIKGTSEIIMCYVIPSDRVISLNSSPEIYKPYLCLNFFKKGAHYGWQIDNQTITPDHLPTLTKKLFEKLLKSVKNQQWNESTFCLQSIGMGIVSEKQPLPSLNIGFQKLSQDPEQILIELMQAAKEAAAKSDEFRIKDKEDKPAVTDKPKNQEKIDDAFLLSSHNLEEALKSLIVLLEQKLQHLVGEGAQALNNHDFKCAQKVLNLTNQLHEFKNQANEILATLKD